MPSQHVVKTQWSSTVFLNPRAIASIILGLERPKETNVNVISYLSTCHNVYVSVLMFFIIIIINY